MSLSRYAFARKIRGGKYYGSSNYNNKIFSLVQSNQVNFTTILLAENQRLDQLAGAFYKDSSLWWVIAAASGIGWGLQVPAGTLVNIPTNLDEVMSNL